MMNSFGDYFGMLSYALQKLDHSELERLYDVVEGCVEYDYPIYLFGNGGSAAIANHWVCDAAKGISEDTGRSLSAMSLCSNVPLMTAIANDLGYDQVFSKQLEYLKPKRGAVAIAISSSGNSKNVVNGLIKAKEIGMIAVALTGFHGGLANSIADFKVYLPVHNYGIVEDTHMMVLHAISQRVRSKFAVSPDDLKL